MSIFANMVPHPNVATFAAMTSTDVYRHLLVYTIVNASPLRGKQIYNQPPVFWLSFIPIGLQWMPIPSASLLDSLTNQLRCSSDSRYPDTIDWFLLTILELHCYNLACWCWRPILKPSSRIYFAYCWSGCVERYRCHTLRLIGNWMWFSLAGSLLHVASAGLHLSNSSSCCGYLYRSWWAVTFCVRVCVCVCVCRCVCVQ